MRLLRPVLAAVLGLLLGHVLVLPASAQFVLNEFLYDPGADAAGDANGDGVRDAEDDEFVEILNTGTVLTNITGWTISDALGVRYTFPSETYLRPDCGIVVFGGGTPTGTFGDMTVQTTGTSTGLSLNNTGDSIFLDDGYELRIGITYGDTVDDESLTRDPDVTGNFTPHSTATGSGGALFSPGTMIDGTAFSGCAAEPSLPIVLFPSTMFTGDSGVPAAEMVTVPASGGVVDVMATITNNTGTLITTEVWPSLTFPDGMTLVKRVPGTVMIADGETIMLTASVRLSESSPTGTYRFNGMAGDHPSAPVSVDGFIIEKEGVPTLSIKYPRQPLVFDTGEILTMTVERVSATSSSPSLGAAYPNPFNPTAAVPFTLTEAGYVRLAVYDVLGREVARLVDGTVEAGVHTATFDAGHLPSGTYLVRFTAADGRVETQRLTLLK